ncbi:unnamed protein product [Brachionus calyciflorus]|uniref:Peptidase M14 domain-containing protein n=2 Tax=Brachionus calyciflorus TaxID=104777 RepID=A0A813VLF6_9BILA|nr:unnamed protein product [Brachionus calyciflorus]
MNLKISLCLAIAFVGCLVQAEQFSFTNYKLVSVLPKTPVHVKLISEWEENPDFDIWTRIKGVEERVNVLLSPNAYLKYSNFFELFKIPFSIVEENMQSRIEEQERSMALSRNSKNIVGRFARYSEIMSFIDNLAADYPNLVTSKVVGQTHEGRNLKVAVIKTPGSKRKVWIDCGIHAREWITPASCIWTINKLVTGYNDFDPAIVSLLNYFEFHIMPLHNPDGYEYSHTTYRLWRKNRKPNRNNPSCIGVDLNRNYGYKWMTGGSSSQPCSDIYAGPSADSELETQAVENYIKQYLGEWDTFLTIHTYGQWWFTSWGFTYDDPPNYDDLKAKAKIGVDAIKEVNGTVFTYGSSAQILYIASGGSDDWAVGEAGIKYSFCLELRPGQTGPDSNYGFTLPEDRAPLAGEETFAGIAAFLNSIKV